MMKTFASILLVAAALLLGSAAQAQDLRVKASIPFDFVLGDKIYPAGVYMVQRAPIGDGSVVTLRDVESQKVRNAITNACTAPKTPEATTLVFDKLGEQYFLRQIWVAGNTSGREFPTSKSETRMAANYEKSEVIVAANLIH